MEESTPLVAEGGRGLLAELILQFERRILFVDAIFEKSPKLGKRQTVTMTMKSDVSQENDGCEDTSSTSSSELWCEAMMIDDFSFSDSSISSVNSSLDQSGNILDDHFAVLEKTIEQACELAKLPTERVTREARRNRVLNILDNSSKTTIYCLSSMPQSNDKVQPLNNVQQKVHQVRENYDYRNPTCVSEDDYDGDCEQEETGQRNLNNRDDMDSDDL